MFDQGLESFTDQQEHKELLKIRKDCMENLKGVERNLVDVYLISNRLPDKWDFIRLTKAICDALPSLQRESVILTLKATSTEMLNDKVEILRGLILKVALLSLSVVFILVPGLSITANIVLMLREISLYRSEPGIPDEGTAKYSMLRTSVQQSIRQTCTHIATAKGVQDLLRLYATEQVLEEASRLIPFVGSVVAGSMSFACTDKCLDRYLKTIKRNSISGHEGQIEHSRN